MEEKELTKVQSTLLQVLKGYPNGIGIDKLVQAAKKKKDTFRPVEIRTALVKLITFKLVKAELIKKEEQFTLTKKGLSKLNSIPDSIGVVEKEKKKDKKPTKRVEEDLFMEFTSPVYVQENAQWEFYQKIEGDIVHIYHSQLEEEIKEMHSSKMMEHISASLDIQKKKENKPKTLPIKINLSEEVRKKVESNDSQKHIGLGHGTAEELTKFVIMDLKLSGHTYNEIISLVSSKFGMSAMGIALLFNEALEEIRKQAKEILKDTIISHSDRYENIYRWFIENGYDKLALKVLERRERIHALHGEEVNQMISSFVSTNGEKDQHKYDFNRLNDNELDELGSLVKSTVLVISKED